MATMTDSVIEHNGHVIKGEVQQTVFKTIKRRPMKGFTSAEVEETLDLDHGKVSGALSMLHKKGVLALLTEKRNGYRVYVMSEFVKGRATKSRKS